VSTNWGNKLKRSAQHIQEGRLDNPRGSETYLEVRNLTVFAFLWLLNSHLSYFQAIAYNGFKRRIISRNPLLLDDDGDVVDDDEEVDNAYFEPIEDNPYKDVKLEGLPYRTSEVYYTH
jgi:hypothetical protein